eukprot:SAG22_NODE_9068_length_611_cov_1.488281_1_plen_84_part_10
MRRPVLPAAALLICGAATAAADEPGFTVALQAAAKTDDAPHMSPLQLTPSANGDCFTISTRDGTDWLGSAGPQFGGVALPREPA